METSKTQSCQSSQEKKEQSRRQNPPRLQKPPQSLSNPEHGAGTKTDIRIGGQNREARNTPHLSSKGERQSLQQVVLGQLDSRMQISAVKTHPHAIQK